MTEGQIEDKIYETKMYISDKFRDIQMQAQSLKNVEDEEKVKQTLTKIRDFVDEVFRGYGTLEELDHEIPEEESSDDDNGFFNY